jgi:hypothetical protein
MQHCSVCGHASVREINAALTARVADREVERRFPGVTRASISRHRRNHLGAGPDDPTAALTPEVLPPQDSKKKGSAAETNIDQRKGIDQQRAVCAATWKLVNQALKKGNLGVATTNLRNLTEAIKALSAHTGELATPGGVAVQVNIGTRDRARWADSSDEALDWGFGRAIARLEQREIERLKLLAAAPCPQCGRFGCKHDTTI